MSTLSREQVTQLTNPTVNSPYNEAYHAIYNNMRLEWKREEKSQHSLLLATPAPYPERELAAVQLALASAQNGTPTVLVDGDLHTPSLQQRFGLPGQGGLSDLLRADSVNARAVQAYLQKTGTAGLSVLCAGAALQPAETSRLLTTRLEAVVHTLRQGLQESEPEPSMLIFHCPPVLAGIDASLISAVVDRTFLVIVAGRTTRTQATKAQEQLERAHARLAGAILLDM